MKKLADDPVGLGEGAFEEGNVEGCGARCKSCAGESMCEGRACDACQCADYDDIV